MSAVYQARVFCTRGKIHGFIPHCKYPKPDFASSVSLPAMRASSAPSSPLVYEAAGLASLVFAVVTFLSF